MALFDYRRKIEQPSPESDKDKNKEVQAEFQVESVVEAQSDIDEPKAVEEVPFEAPPPEAFPLFLIDSMLTNLKNKQT